MSRELVILRHANALPLTAGGADLERPLSSRGEHDADSVTAWFRSHDIAFDRAVASPAARSKATAERVLGGLGGPSCEFDPAIYNATPGDLVDVLDARLGPGRTLLVGHNPGLEELVALLTSGRSDDFRGLPTAGTAWLVLEDGPLEPGHAKLKAFWSP